VLSPTHLHEFKNADAVYTQAPVMSLYLPDQKLGAHSQPGSSSHKFILKGRQTGAMHRGHSWVFRAETYDTMLAWYEDITSLTEKTGEERNRFVRGHSRSFSQRSAVSTSSFDDDEADIIPYSTESAASLSRLNSNVATNAGHVDPQQQRPQPGGSFPVLVQNRNHLLGTSVSSEGSELNQDLSTTAGGHQPATFGNNLSPESVKTSVVSTPQDQRSLGHHEGAMYVSQMQENTPNPSSTQSASTIRPVQPPTNDEPNHDLQNGVGAGILGAAAVSTTNHYEANGLSTAGNEVKYHESPERPIKPTLRGADSFRSQNASIQSYPATSLPASPINETTSPLEAEMPHPGLSRKSTDVSVSNLHIPGEYPKSR
jgi:hypothetical protein